jgi:DNA-binding NarL/FixJ family response regulator
MAKRVGVFNAPPVYVIGLTGLTEANGYMVESVDNPRRWVIGQPNPVLLLGIRSPSDLEIVSELRSLAPSSVLVTLIDQFAFESVRESLMAGASGTVSRDAGVREIALALEAAIQCNSIIPTDFAYRMAAQTSDRPRPLLQDSELTWLQSLARSATVADLGESAGYSEREMYRRLNAIYRKMGVRSRTEALLKASRLGWIN